MRVSEDSCIEIFFESRLAVNVLKWKINFHECLCLEGLIGKSSSYNGGANKRLQRNACTVFDELSWIT